MRESDFQSQLIKKLHAMFPDCIVLKNDPTYIQGMPDLLVLNGDKWGGLECKKSKTAHHQPNQDYYVETMNEMSYAAFIYPENEERILNELEQAFRPGG